MLEYQDIALLISRFFGVIRDASADSQGFTLPGDIHLWMNSFNQNGSVPYNCLYFFFRNSFSIFMAPRVFKASSY